MAISLDFATAVATPLQCIIYGLSVYMFGVTFTYLMKKHPGPSSPRPRFNVIVLSATCLLFMFSTIHLISCMYRLIAGLVIHRSTPGGPLEFLGNTASWHFLTNTAAFLAQTLLGDAVVMYRCYLVWGTVWIIFLPAMLWLTTLGTGIAIVWNFTRLQSNLNVFGTLTTHLTGACFGSSVSGNVISTGLLAYRLWKASRSGNRYRVGDGHLQHVARVVVDSGVLYSITQILFVALFFSGSNVSFVFREMMIPIISICFYMVLLRNARGLRMVSDQTETSDRSFELSSPRGRGRGRDEVEINLNTEITVSDVSSKGASKEKLTQMN